MIDFLKCIFVPLFILFPWFLQGGTTCQSGWVCARTGPTSPQIGPWDRDSILPSGKSFHYYDNADWVHHVPVWNVHFNSSHSALAYHSIIYQPLHPEVISANKLVPECSPDFVNFSLVLEFNMFNSYVGSDLNAVIGTENPQLLGAAPVSHFLCFPI